MKYRKLLAALCLSSLFLFQGCGQAAKTEAPAPTEKADTSTAAPIETKKAAAATETAAPAETKKTETETVSPPADTKPSSTSTPAETETPTPTEAALGLDEQVERYLSEMSLEEKVAQMFIVLPEALTGADLVNGAGDQTREAIEKTPVGGLVYLEQNLQTPSQVSEMLENVQTYSMERIGLPAFTCIDEEGGSVARLNHDPNFGLPYIGDMSEIGASGNVQSAYDIGLEIGGYLSELGFNVDFAPVADVLTNPDNTVVRSRSFGSDPLLVADMASAVSAGLNDSGVLSTFKHFPGHGATEGDTHEGYAYTPKTLEELSGSELLPFQRGIDEGVDMIMVGHISLPAIIGDDTPASLSYKMITEILRKQMGYDGLVITDAMNMGAISQLYTSADAAIKSIQSGTDLILMPADFADAYQGVLNAINNQISVERIDESARRIIRAKSSLLQD